jgi:hypothetical protein
LTKMTSWAFNSHMPTSSKVSILLNESLWPSIREQSRKKVHPRVSESPQPFLGLRQSDQAGSSVLHHK